MPGYWSGKAFSKEHKDKIVAACARRKRIYGCMNSIDTRLKISKALTGRSLQQKTKDKISKKKKGKISNSKGKHWHQSKKRIKPYRIGNKNSNWKGGITPENSKIRHSIEFRLWRESVFARDNYTCQKYKVKGGRLHPHHIKNFAEFPELRFIIDNGITLSDKAHIEFHKKYGYKNNTIDQLYEYLNS